MNINAQIEQISTTGIPPLSGSVPIHRNNIFSKYKVKIIKYQINFR
jgi:hypothetical protein